ncbi:MAG TPA: hypothetical protein VLA83_09115, partial [Candidatus Binatia bacterium]|nr:hypothetical protein [Candidatus Binatia bacterium]
GEKLRERIVGLEVIKRVTTQAADEKDRRMFAGSFWLGDDCLVICAVDLDGLVERGGGLGVKRYRG